MTEKKRWTRWRIRHCGGHRRRWLVGGRWRRGWTTVVADRAQSRCKMELSTGGRQVASSDYIAAVSIRWVNDNNSRRSKWTNSRFRCRTSVSLNHVTCSTSLLSLSDVLTDYKLFSLRLFNIMFGIKLVSLWQDLHPPSQHKKILIGFR